MTTNLEYPDTKVEYKYKEEEIIIQQYWNKGAIQTSILKFDDIYSIFEHLANYTFDHPKITKAGDIYLD